jgi:hypothetical protein
VLGTPAAVERAEETRRVTEAEDRQGGMREVVRDPALRRAPPSQASTASFAFAFSFALTDSTLPPTLMMLACGHFCTQMPQLVHFA